MTSRFFPFQLSRDDVAAAATKNGDKSIEQQLADSFNSNNAVLAYARSLTGTQLPHLTPPLPWYDKFQSQFADAKVHAMLWQNTVTPGLVGIPTGILNFALLWSLNNATITQAIDVLDRDPHNQEAKDTVVYCLRELHAGVGRHLAAATQFQGTIKDFSSKLTSDAKLMNEAIQQATKSAGYNEGEVARLVKHVEELRNEISKWQIVVTASAIGAGVSFWLGAVIAIFSFGFGLAFSVVGAATGIALMIAADVKIKQLTAQVELDQKNMKELNVQIATLKLIEENLTTLVKLSEAASAQVELILKAWDSLEKEILAVLDDVTAAQGDVERMNLTALRTDMAQANVDWQALQGFCSVISGIHYNEASPPTADLEPAKQPASV
ncbi:HBL/NHE enterotoxin family protein [Phytohabitans rumicis]|uniref:Enterotoxin n=1 Tax=Phytohabitans rumicis TaxID=1076125 RepID=A0A6V8KYT1_9ACTN|nr:HBL/NHE enterotoxin family protein [Phytohabitans rumicis]GFJ86956.1 hypothetical protein Prum_005980 [Phytohabitans rumicis]